MENETELESLDEELEQLQNSIGPVITTDTQSEEDAVEGERPQMEMPWGGTRDAPRPGVGGFVQDVAEGTYEDLAPYVGLSDTVIDAVNFVTPGNIPDIPKLPEYESNAATALRNISGLVIPSLGLRGMLLKGGAKMHATATAPKFLQNLGNSKSFSYFA